MNQNVLHHLSLLAEAHGVYAEDFSDELMSKYTSLGLIALATVLALKQYIFKPIQCWVPAEWPRPWEEYAENYCWIQNTYHVAMLEPGHPGLQARKESEISYFQWVPILLSIQAVLVLAPHMFWRLASAHSGLDPHQIVKLARELEGVKSLKKRRKLTAFLAGQLRRALTIAAASCSCWRKTCGGLLFACYLASKAVYLLGGVGHLYLMKTYLGFEELSFGWNCARDLLKGRQWQQTRIFPRVTFCDVPIRHLSQWNTRSVQCVLPSNMLHEKVYIFLWFWVIFCMTVTAVYSANWVASLVPPSQRQKLVTRLLRMARPPSAFGWRPDQQSRNPPLEDLALDGVFILQMVASNCGDLCAAKILEALRVPREENQPARHDSSDDVERTLPLRGMPKSLDAGIPSPDYPMKEANSFLGQESKL